MDKRKYRYTPKQINASKTRSNHSKQLHFMGAALHVSDHSIHHQVYIDLKFILLFLGHNDMSYIKAKKYGLYGDDSKRISAQSELSYAYFVKDSSGNRLSLKFLFLFLDTTKCQSSVKSQPLFMQEHQIYCNIGLLQHYNLLPILTNIVLISLSQYLRINMVFQSWMLLNPQATNVIYIYIYGAHILDVSRSHTTTQHSRQDSSG